MAMSLASATAPAQEVKPDLALMGTVPIYWGEAGGLDEILSGEVPGHWARPVLEERFSLSPLDYLSAETLADRRYLLMAQPRGLSGEENVALDNWVREGGTLLLFADPMMTGESRFHVGDRRRPQDVALLSPLLAHWGLELVFDAAQAEGPQSVDHFGNPIPVNMRGEFRHAGEMQYCAIPGDGLLAHCVIGAGQAMIVADAAMLDIAGPESGAEAALKSLLDHVFANLGDSAGMGANPSLSSPSNTANTDEAATDETHIQQSEGSFYGP